LQIFAVILTYCSSLIVPFLHPTLARSCFFLHFISQLYHHAHAHRYLHPLHLCPLHAPFNIHVHNLHCAYLFSICIPHTHARTIASRLSVFRCLLFCCSLHAAPHRTCPHSTRSPLIRVLPCTAAPSFLLSTSRPAYAHRALYIG
jgi:hypothetical protein